MKILGISCSPRKGGNTEILVKEALEGARGAGGETEFISIVGKDIAPCDGCGSCEKNGVCRIDDYMQEIYKQIELADGVIFGTPVYFINVSAQAKAVMDRTYAYRFNTKLRGKVAAAIVAARRVGGGNVLSLLYSYFTAQRMILAGGGIGYGLKRGDVKEGPGGAPGRTALEEARAVGKGVVRMIKRLG
jgi:multimeric flavodoxin WrbA